MIDYSNKEKNYDWYRSVLLQDLRPANFAVFCGTIHIADLEYEVEKLITDIEHKELPKQYTDYKVYFIDFLQRATKAILNNSLENIHPDEEKHILFAQGTIME